MHFRDWARRAAALLHATPVSLDLANLIPAPENQPARRVLPTFFPDRELAAQAGREPCNHPCPWAQNEFALKLFAALVEETPGKNVFVSPAGIAAALLVFYSQAGRAAREAMERALGLPREHLHETAGSWLKALTTRDNLQLCVASSVWVRRGTPVEEKCIEEVGRHYAAEVHVVDFDSTTQAAMDEWVQRKTSGKIQSVAAEGNTGAPVRLLNAVYFKGAWFIPFDPQYTYPGTFTRTDGSRKTLPMMARLGFCAQFHSDGMFQAVRLAYTAKGFSMYVFLPRGDLRSFARWLCSMNWDEVVGGPYNGMAHLELPRFTVRYTTSLNEVASSLGLGPVFASADHGLWVDAMNHQTFCEVDEAGTRAAALTGLMLLGGPERIIVDRPFCCAVVDDRTGGIVFLGAIEDPE